MSVAIKQNTPPNARTAKTNDLEKLIGTCRIGLTGTGNMTGRAKRWYYFFGELAAKGYSVLEAPMEAIAHFQYLAIGQTHSVSTAKRAIRELEDAGYIKRRRFLPRGISIIDINTEQFNFYIRQNPTYNIPPVGTFTHKSVHRSNCPPDEFTISYGEITKSGSDVVTTSKLDKDNCKKNAKKNAKKSFQDWIHPLVFSIGIVAYGFGRQQREELQRACLSAIHDDVEPFCYWSPERWRSNSLPVREKLAREMLPELRRYIKHGKVTMVPIDNIPGTEIVRELNTHIREMPPNESLLTDEEYKILFWADKNRRS